MKLKTKKKILLVLGVILSNLLGYDYLNYKFNNKFTRVSEKALETIVDIKVKYDPGTIEGAGVVITPNGHVLTVAHLFTLPYRIRHIGLVKYDGSEFWARIVKVDKTRDLALLQVPCLENSNSKYSRFAPLGQLKVGQEVFTIGSPLGLPFSVTNGIISYLHRDVFATEYTEHQYNAMTNPGNSGGPVFNLDGEIVGVANLLVSIVPLIPIDTGVSFFVTEGSIVDFLKDYKEVGKVLK